MVLRAWSSLNFWRKRRRGREPSIPKPRAAWRGWRVVVPKISKVEVRVREGRAVNIHMFCARRPRLLLSAMRALDGLGLDIQQAVISCFNCFALDVLRAEQCKDGPGVFPEEIKAVLLHSAGFQSTM